MVRPSSAPRGELHHGSTEQNGVGRSTPSSAVSPTTAPHRVPPDPFTLDYLIAQLEAERLQPVSYYGPVTRLHHDLHLLVRVLDEMLTETSGGVG